MLPFAVVFWIPAFAGMTAETGTHIRHAGEARHPGGFPKRKFSTSKHIRSWNISSMVSGVCLCPGLRRAEGFIKFFKSLKGFRNEKR